MIWMRQGAKEQRAELVSNSMEFMKGALSKNFPPNLIVIVNTDDGNYSGYLQDTGSSTEMPPPALGTLVTEYVSKGIMDLAITSSSHARSAGNTLETPSGNKPWCDISAVTRGGWRGLVLARCGLGLLSKDAFDDVRKLVQK